MLETKGLVKIYKPKKGVPVRALDGVSLKFPDKGMVFLLGKSGSGKSTLLNLLGGLDKYDGGEIIIKNVSSKDFSQKHFDSYRNTYVGFIFQEYNVLDDFTVGANIALAIELQGKKATDEELNRILHEVDLDGYGNRRPNELSGGQKQRVAIARALVKNPKIIMADEPTGALDSVTGRQVFDTLKKLSAEKLVIVVSHDREFAMNYADRIIELADGKVISDTSFDENTAPVQEGIIFDGATAKIPMGYHLTEEDRIAINEYIDRLGSGAELGFEKRSDRKFVPTDEETIKNEDVSPFALIKSKLSFKHAFKIGGSGLKHKKFRLTMTIFLSCIAFILFGLVDTFSAYDHINTSANSIKDSNIRYVSVNQKQLCADGERYSYVKSSDSDLKAFEAATGISLKGVLAGANVDLAFSQNIEYFREENTNYSMFRDRFNGIVEIDDSDIASMKYSVVAGKLPDGKKDEIAISKFVADLFVKSGYIPAQKLEAVPYGEVVEDIYIEDGKFEDNVLENPEEKTEKIKIKSASDMLGRTLIMGGVEYTVVGVVDTKLDMERYATLFEPITEEEGEQGFSHQLLEYALYEEFNTAVNYDFTGMMLVGKGFIKRYTESGDYVSYFENSHLYFDHPNGLFYLYAGGATTLDKIKEKKIIWVNGEKEKLADNEIIISSNAAESYLNIITRNEFGEMEVDIESASEISLDSHYYDYASGYEEGVSDVKIVGIMMLEEFTYTPLHEAVVLSDGLYSKYFMSTDGLYEMAIGAMPENRGDIKNLVKHCYTDNNGVTYKINNPACFELDAVNEVIEILADIFFWVGLFFAVFASILLSNFIATSISYKKQEIGILRAIGSRGNDVFRIFFSEAFIIAMINFTLASVGTGVITFITNYIIRTKAGLLVTVLNFGIRQILVLFLISIAVAAIASFFPVKRVASKRPIDAIRDR